MDALHESWKARERRDDARFALLCAVLANCHRDPKRRPKPYQVEDFMPEKRPKTRAEHEARLRQFAHAMNARIIKPETN